eukprot:6741725-Prymnesium_polylepis.2
MMRALGAEVEVVKPAAIANPEHPVNVARRRAAELGVGSIFCNQFENLANTHAHERTTAREVRPAAARGRLVERTTAHRMIRAPPAVERTSAHRAHPGVGADGRPPRRIRHVGGYRRHHRGRVAIPQGVLRWRAARQTAPETRPPRRAALPGRAATALVGRWRLPWMRARAGAQAVGPCGAR